MLAHIFNTGQGVVTERSPHSDWVYFEAAYQQVFLFTCRGEYKAVCLVEPYQPRIHP